MYNGLSKVYASNQKEECSSIQRVKPTCEKNLVEWPAHAILLLPHSVRAKSEYR